MEKACKMRFQHSDTDVRIRIHQHPDIMFHFKKIQNHLVGAVSAELRKKYLLCENALGSAFT